MHIVVLFILWLIVCFLIPRAVKPLEAGYGIVTIGSLIIWTFVWLGFSIWVYNV
jgi:hypothetical protein